MATAVDTGTILNAFARLLEYPRARLARVAEESAAVLREGCPAAAADLERFHGFLEARTLGQLQETYTRVFDLNATCPPYVGYHLLGDTYRRSQLLVGLKERFRAEGFDAGEELPDHLAVLLRYAATRPGTDAFEELVREGLLPALGKMLGAREAGEDEGAAGDDAGAIGRDVAEPGAYGELLRALELYLETTVSEGR